MIPASDPPSSYAQETAPARRAIGLAFAIAANLLILLLLLNLAPSFPLVKMARHGLIALQLAPDREKAASGKKASQKAARPSNGAPPKAAARTNPTPPLPVARPEDNGPLQGVLQLSKEDYAASDVAKIAPHRPDHGQGQSSGQLADAGGLGDTPSIAGGAPGGQPLYLAEWYREPTNAELSTYLPHNVPEHSWGMIICQTVARFHVENCQELGDAPAGSGIARGMRQAAWQFLVRPPRVGGQSLIGSWVRIRIDFTEKPQLR